MAGIAGKLCWGRAIGVYLREGHVDVTEVGTTLRGVTVLARHQASVGEAGPGAALKALLTERLTRRQLRRVSVCVGLGAEQTFFATRRFDAEQHAAPSAGDLLAAAGADGMWEPSQVVADGVRVGKLKVGGRAVYGVAACRHELAEEVFSALGAAGVQNARLEPGPWSLPAAADRSARAPARWKLTVRVLLHEQGGLAVLVADGQALLWRRFTLSADRPARSVVSAIRTVMVHAIVSLGIREVRGVVIQGAGAKALARQAGDDLGMEVVAGGGQGLTDELCSYALALSGRADAARSLDLFRTLRPPPSMRETFPWKLAGMVLAMTVCMAFVMWDRASGLTRDRRQLSRQNAAHSWSRNQKTRMIDKERKQLLAEVGAVSRFLSTRVVWSDYLRDLPTRLPANACLSNVWGFCELEDMSSKKQKRKSNKSLTLRGMTRFADRGASPKEIDAFLEQLRKVDLLRRDFPQVQLAEIKWRREGTSEIAMFTIVALPKKK